MTTGVAGGSKNPGIGPIERALFLLSFACGLAYLATQGIRPYTGSVVVKQFAIFPLAVVAVRALKGADGLLLGLALWFSYLGDIFLGIEGADLFSYGLGCFLVAHVFYLILFARSLPQPLELGFGRKLAVFLLLFYSGAMTTWLGPDLGPLAGPVMLYLGAISAMCLAAILLKFRTPLVMSGALLFVASDSLIAINRFKWPIEHSEYLIWASYYAGQLFITAGFLGEKLGAPIVEREAGKASRA